MICNLSNYQFQNPVQESFGTSGMDIASTLRSLLLSNPNSTSTLLSTLPANTLDLIKLASSNSEMANLFNNPVSQINNRDTGSIPSSKLSGKEVICEICGK